MAVQGALETSATFQDLHRMLSQPGCAICRYMAQSEHRYFDTLLYEEVTSPATEQRLRASVGFCPRHLRTLLAWRDPLATAILYKPILHDKLRLLAEWRRARRPPRPDPRMEAVGLDCPACAAERESERRALEVLAEGLERGSLRPAWEASEGLCWPHFVGARRLCRQARAVLDAVEAERLQALATDLETLIDSFDYRSRVQRTPGVETAWRRVVEVLAGRLAPERTRTQGPGATG
jgi:hypothetical protein